VVIAWIWQQYVERHCGNCADNNASAQKWLRDGRQAVRARHEATERSLATVHLGRPGIGVWTKSHNLNDALGQG
jgi:hypothetical protein